MGWPAPQKSTDAIDEGELDLVMAELLRNEEHAARAARYLLDSHDTMARTIRHRINRWERAGEWTSSDGLIDPAGVAANALAAHRMDARAYSATALQRYARCPRQFYLHSIARLEPRQEVEAIEQLDAWQRGSLIHEILQRLYSWLQEQNLLPLTSDHLPRARQQLAVVAAKVAASHREQLAPAIDRVWDDGIAAIVDDLLELLRPNLADRPWTPVAFERPFGFGDDGLELDIGLRLRGCIDLIERHHDGALRATDYKTGKAHVDGHYVVHGGEVLQPLLLVLLALVHTHPEVLPQIQYLHRSL